MTRALLIALAVAAVASTGCGSKKSPPAAPSAAPGPSAAAPAAQAPPAGAAATAPKPSAEPEWAYSSVGRRDPFRSFLAEVQATSNTLTTRCTTPLGRFELEQLKLVAVVTGLEDPVAMVQAPNGIGYAIRHGACIGKNGGIVAAVRGREVVVSEWVVRADGTRDRTQTILSLPREAALNLEE